MISPHQLFSFQYVMDNTHVEEWQEELSYLKERVAAASSDSKREIQKRISELESRIKKQKPH